MQINVPFTKNLKREIKKGRYGSKQQGPQNYTNTILHVE